MAISDLNTLIQNNKVLEGAIRLKPTFDLEYIKGIDEITYKQLLMVARAIERKAKPGLYMFAIRQRIVMIDAVLRRIAIMIKSARLHAPELLPKFKNVYKNLAMVRFNLIKFRDTNNEKYLVAAMKLIAPIT